MDRLHPDWVCTLDLSQPALSNRRKDGVTGIGLLDVLPPAVLGSLLHDRQPHCLNTGLPRREFGSLWVSLERPVLGQTGSSAVPEAAFFSPPLSHSKSG